MAYTPVRESSKALTKSSNDSKALTAMAPPPLPKKILRPAMVLDEDTYTSSLSEIIARDFFPGLVEVEARQEYLDALDSNDREWIASAGAELHRIVTQSADRGERGKKRAADGTEVDTNLSLSQFQAKYTSEDNESFYQLLDEQNKKRAEKYTFLHQGNKIAGFRVQKERERAQKLLREREETENIDGKPVKLITEGDERRAMPDSWNAKAKNELMFSPDGVDDADKQAEAVLRTGPRSINYANTRLKVNPHEAPAVVPPSPSMSAVRDAISGNPRPTASEVDLPDIPTVNGYSFVDPNPNPEAAVAPDRTPGPFEIRESSAREKIHHRIVARTLAKQRKKAADSKVGPEGLMSPAAKRLLGQVSTPRRTDVSAFDAGAATPRRGAMTPRERWTPRIKRESET